jgi:focal adhesion kinase 1
LSQNHHQQQQAPTSELQAFLDARLRRQQEESEKDSRWLHQQEENIKKRLSIASLNDLQIEQNTNGGTNHVITGKPPVAEKVPLSPRVPNNEPTPSSSSPQLIEKKIDLKIDRANDPIYKCTTNVVRAVMTLSSGVEKSQINEYLELVKSVGLELRELLGTVDRLCNFFPPQTHK